MTKMTTQDEIALKSKSRICVICGTMYSDAGSMGRLQCTEHRATYLVKKGDGWIWPCCGKRAPEQCTQEQFYLRRYDPVYRGCIKADHKDTLEPYSCRPKMDHPAVKYSEEAPSWAVAPVIADRLKLPTTAHLDKKDGFTIIYRYEKK